MYVSNFLYMYTFFVSLLMYRSGVQITTAVEAPLNKQKNKKNNKLKTCLINWKYLALLAFIYYILNSKCSCIQSSSVRNLNCKNTKFN